MQTYAKTIIISLTKLILSNFLNGLKVYLALTQLFAPPFVEKLYLFENGWKLVLCLYIYIYKWNAYHS